MKTVKLSKASASQHTSQILTAAQQFLLIVPADRAARFYLILTAITILSLIISLIIT